MALQPCLTQEGGCASSPPGKNCRMDGCLRKRVFPTGHVPPPAAPASESTPPSQGMTPYGPCPQRAWCFAGLLRRSGLAPCRMVPPRALVFSPLAPQRAWCFAGLLYFLCLPFSCLLLALCLFSIVQPAHVTTPLPIPAFPVALEAWIDVTAQAVAKTKSGKTTDDPFRQAVRLTIFNCQHHGLRLGFGTSSALLI